MAKPPKWIVVGIKRFRLVIDKAKFDRALVAEGDLNCDGLCRLNRQKILVRPGLGADTTAELIAHEVTHAALEPITGDGLTDELEERVCRWFGHALVQIVRDNPDLVAYWQGG